MRWNWVTIALAGGLLGSVTAAAQDTPPPRSVSDLKSRLAAAQHAAPADISAANRVAPVGASTKELASFYRDRGLAAEAVGRDAQALQDYTQALINARSSGLKLKPYLVAAAFGEMWVGNLLNARNLFEEQLRTASTTNMVERIAPTRLLLEISLRLGDFRSAEVHLAWLERLSRQSESWTGSEGVAFVPTIRANFHDGRARYLLASGQPADAEASIRRTFTDTERYISNAVARPSLLEAVTVPMLRENYERRILVLADSLTRQGKLVEAEQEARRSLNKMLERGVRGGAHASTLIGALADILIEQGRFSEAEALAREAEATLVAVVGDSAKTGGVANARLRIAQVLALRGKPRHAGEIVSAIVDALDNDASALFRLQSFDPILLTALARARHRDQAEAAARKFLDSRRRALGDGNYATAEARGFLGGVLWVQGKKDEALAAFREAVPVLSAQTARAEDQVARTIRFQAILEAYLALLFEMRGSPSLQGLDLAAETFRLAEVARGRSVQRAIAASAARVVAGNRALAELVRVEQDLGHRIAGLNQTLLETISLPLDQEAPSAQSALRSDIEKLVTERKRVAAEIARQFPDYDELIDPKPVTLAATQALLKPGEALVTFLVGVEESYVWAVPAQGQPIVAVVKRGAEDVAEAVAELRISLDPQVARITDILPFDTELANRLHDDFLGPVVPALAQTKNLLVVPHGPLAQLPFGLLVTDKPGPPKTASELFAAYRPVPWLIRKTAVTQLPSVATLTALRRLPPSKPGRMPLIAFADPVFAPEQATGAANSGTVAVRGERVALRALPRTAELDSADLAKLPRLPDTADEVNAIAAALGADPARDLFLGPRASVEAVLASDLSNRRVVMFATHGLMAGDLDGLTQPALALSSPRVTGGKADGLLTLDKVMGLKLDADWVVLSACNTAASAGGDGAKGEALSGLARAFFYAGARSLLVSNWSVESASATALTVGLFKRQAADPTMGRAEALRQSMLAMIDRGALADKRGKPVIAYAHPLFWAPFSLVGDGWSGGPN